VVLEQLSNTLAHVRLRLALQHLSDLTVRRHGSVHDSNLWTRFGACRGVERTEAMLGTSRGQEKGVGDGPEAVNWRQRNELCDL